MARMRIAELKSRARQVRTMHRKLKRFRAPLIDARMSAEGAANLYHGQRDALAREIGRLGYLVTYDRSGIVVVGVSSRVGVFGRIWRAITGPVA